MRVSQSIETAVECDSRLSANRKRSQVHSDVTLELLYGHIKIIIVLTSMYRLNAPITDTLER